jgi:hypothetical protein
MDPAIRDRHPLPVADPAAACRWAGCVTATESGATSIDRFGESKWLVRCFKEKELFSKEHIHASQY